MNNFQDEDRRGLQIILHAKSNHLERRLALVFKLFTLHLEGLQSPPRTYSVHELSFIPLPDDVDEEFDCNDDDDDINNPLF